MIASILPPRVSVFVFLFCVLMVGASIALALPPGVKERPSAEGLPSVKGLPDPFLFEDGTRVKSAGEWDRRRSELKELVQFYEYGHLPPAPGNVKATEVQSFPYGGSRSGAKEQIVQLTMGPNDQVKTTVHLTVPPGRGPFPVIIRGDLCWGRLDQAIRDSAVKRGYIIAEFDRTDFAPDNKTERGKLYAAYPQHDTMSAVSAWAWGFHRVVDYVLTRPDVDGKKVIATGHSRGGKCVLLAGATDERIALTAPNNSGCGGAGCFRYQAPKSEDIGAILKNFPYWFQPNFKDFIGKEDRLPIDQHSVKALVAPRAFLSTEALGDAWANPEGSQVSHDAAKKVYEFLGVPEKIGIVFREGGHEHNLADFNVLMDFADKVLLNKGVERKFDQPAFPDAPKPYAWSAPSGS